ncbi:carboxypeptidase regulatory-like domain-containing protein [Sphingomonas sanguinis]|uniref:TonB-dependent receptor n=1 Tax=Sphingomonas sanguinis TaxID=33051 RepID=UPI001C5701F6|nr:carboxypeptidase regulatory-like domain-containing protein [Sphingomonas sanguinis]QXT36101.1 carboxypeptidase regulatory-like domain-containing protein [Sphingomonas sanguinis]
MALQALAMVGAGIGAVALATPAMAQDYTTGAISGTVVDTANKPVAGVTVTLRSKAQNQVRTFVSSATGRFSAVGLVPGLYDVTTEGANYATHTDTITVAAAQENRVTLTVVAKDAPANEVVVTGQRVREDFTKTTTGINLDVVATAAQLPIGRSVTALALLAPGAVAGAPGFGNVASLGGSSVAENAYYINGLNITNPDTYVGSARVPFDFYQTVDVQTAGYAAEFGRATGGVINATTKSGTNTPMMAIHGNFDETGLQSSNPNIGAATNPSTIGRLAHTATQALSIEAGGPIIKDHIFLYGLYQANDIVGKSASPLSNYYQRTISTDPFYGGKLDVYVNPTQHLEFTLFDTRQTTRTDSYTFTPNSSFTGGTPGKYTGSQNYKQGGLNWVGRYTGSITDFFQISGAYGISRDSSNTLPLDTASYYVIDRRTATTGGLPQVISAQPYSGNSINNTQRKFYRIDGDLRFEALGRHHIRFGLDNEDVSETKISTLNGGLPIIYDYRNTGARLTYERLGGFVSGQDRAYYVQDSWEPARGLTINLGVRDDEFQQYNLSGQRYLSLKDNIAARAGFSWTPGGDSRFRFNGSYGRYFIPPAMNLGFRGRDLYFREYFAYPTGFTAANFPVNPNTGLPLANFGPALTNLAGAGYGSACPTDISAAPGNPINGAATCLIYGAGIQDPAAAKLAVGAKPTYEDEFVLGAHFRVTELFSVGLTGTYRNLGRVSEDTDFAPFLANYYCNGGANASATQCDFYQNNSTYYIWNPGRSSQTVRDWVDPTKSVTLTGLAFPKPKRQYEALVFDWKRADDGVWALQGSITVSRSYGNYEGTVKSDAGNGTQSDAGSTQDYDYLGLTDYSTGLLPNDRTFVLKTFGSYHVTDNLLFGTNVLVQSPTRLSCLGYHPTDPNAAGYNASSFYCAYGALNSNGNYTMTQPSPRGTGLRTQWVKQIDLSFRYRLPEAWGFKNFVLRADAFNVFNSQPITQRYVQHENAKSGSEFTPDPLYGTPYGYLNPRSVRLGFDILF